MAKVFLFLFEIAALVLLGFICSELYLLKAASAAQPAQSSLCAAVAVQQVPSSPAPEAVSEPPSAPEASDSLPPVSAEAPSEDEAPEPSSPDSPAESPSPLI